jgi:protein subunit release factor B
LQYAFKVNVFGFEIGRIGIGNVQAKQFHATAAHAKGLLMHPKGVVKHIHMSPFIAKKHCRFIDRSWTQVRLS